MAFHLRISLLLCFLTFFLCVLTFYLSASFTFVSCFLFVVSFQVFFQLTFDVFLISLRFTVALSGFLKRLFSFPHLFSPLCHPNTVQVFRQAQTANPLKGRLGVQWWREGGRG